MKIKEIIKIIENYAPPALQESYDNAGIIAGDKENIATGVLVCLDVTEKVVNEAIDKHCNLIISHHPLIFSGIKSITGKNEVERIIVKAIKNDLAIYSAHTNLDNVLDGVNGMIAKKLGLKNIRVLSPKKEVLRKLITFCPKEHADKVREAIFKAGAGHIGNYDCCSFNIQGTGSFRGLDGSDPYAGKAGEVNFEEEVRIETVFPAYLESSVLQAMLKVHPYEEVAYDIYPLLNNMDRVGAGLIGSIEPQIEEMAFLKELKSIFEIPCIRHTELTGKRIKKVAICGGSGSFLIRDAIRKGAQVFITGDIKYHDFFLADGKLLLADVGHYESEQFTKELLYSILIKKIPNFAIFISEVRTNPINYF